MKTTATAPAALPVSAGPADEASASQSCRTR